MLGIPPAVLLVDVQLGPPFNYGRHATCRTSNPWGPESHSVTFSSEQLLRSLSQTLITQKGMEMEGGVLNGAEMGAVPG